MLIIVRSANGSDGVEQSQSALNSLSITSEPKDFAGAPRPSKKHKGWILSPDVLFRILELLVTYELPIDTRCQYPKEARDFSQVCRKFRTVALDSPIAWGSLWSGLNDFWLETCVSRSKEMGLDIYCTMWPNRYQEAHSLARFLPFQHRWRSVSVYIRYGLHPSKERQVRNLYANLKLPVLEKLGIRDNDLDGCKTPDFYSSWLAPKLQHYQGWDHVPSPSILAGLTSLNLTSTDILGGHSRSFFAHLERGQQLRRLDLYMLSFPWNTQEQFDRKIRLPLLSEFHLYSVFDPPVKALARYLELPALSHLELDVESDCLASRINHLVGLGNIQTSLVSFTGTIYRKKFLDLRIVEAIPAFRNLKHLDLRFAGGCFGTRPTQAKLPKLQALHLRFFEKFDATHLASFAAAHLSANGGSLQRVEVVSRVDLSPLKRVFHQKVPERMISWKVDPYMNFGQWDCGFDREIEVISITPTGRQV